ncbi:MAG: HAMP domain-containing sensor histidine kinase [Acidobacteriota bacterium]
MLPRRSSNIPSLIIHVIYLLALATTTALLVFWVLVVQRFDSEINQLIGRLGVEWNHFHWFIQSTGAALFFLVIVALTSLLALTLAERRYARKQEAFFSTITHELKSPVAAIKLHAQSLALDDDAPGGDRDDDDARAERKRSLGYIVAEADRVGLLVDNLLESSRRLAGRDQEELAPINLRNFFHEYQQAARGRFDVRRIDLRFEVQTRAWVMATSDGLERVMDNLISNAVRFTDPGGRIEVAITDGQDGTEIVVADDGIGIPRGELGKIFDRFYRIGRELRGRVPHDDDAAASPRRRHAGTGLGLSIVRGLVRQMRGTIRATSTEDRRGTRFEIRLPPIARPPIVHDADPTDRDRERPRA